MAEHARRLGRDEAPLLHQFLGMTMDERWVEREPEEMLRSFHWFAGEGFELIVEEILALATLGGVVVEGFRLLPRLVAPLLAEPRSAAWMLPTPAFRRSAFESRGSLGSISERTSDPGRALVNLLERDRLFTELLRAEIHELGLQAVEVDVGESEDTTYERVLAVLRDGPAQDVN